MDKIIALPIETQKQKETFQKSIQKYLQQKMLKFKKIDEYNKKKAYQLLHMAITIVNVSELTDEHKRMIIRAIGHIETGSNSHYDLYKLDKMLFDNEEELFCKKDRYGKTENQLYSVRKDLKCLKCDHLGAISYAGKWNPRLKDLSPAVGFGGTIPYECTNCNTLGLVDMTLEGYAITFEQI
jgi:hypothetical protein